jgi:hypothetical protein
MTTMYNAINEYNATHNTHAKYVIRMCNKHAQRTSSCAIAFASRNDAHEYARDVSHRNDNVIAFVYTINETRYARYINRTHVYVNAQKRDLIHLHTSQTTYATPQQIIAMSNDEYDAHHACTNAHQHDETRARNARHERDINDYIVSWRFMIRDDAKRNEFDTMTQNVVNALTNNERALLYKTYHTRNVATIVRKIASMCID